MDVYDLQTDIMDSSSTEDKIPKVFIQIALPHNSFSDLSSKLPL